MCAWYMINNVISWTSLALSRASTFLRSARDRRDGTMPRKGPLQLRATVHCSQHQSWFHLPPPRLFPGNRRPSEQFAPRSCIGCRCPVPLPSYACRQGRARHPSVTEGMAGALRLELLYQQDLAGACRSKDGCAGHGCISLGAWVSPVYVWCSSVRVRCRLARF